MEKSANIELCFSTLKAIFSRVKLPINTCDENGIITYVSPKTCELFGYSANELEGKSIGILNSYEKAENEKIVAQVIETLKSRGFWEGRFDNRKKNGELFQTYGKVMAAKVDGKTQFVTIQNEMAEKDLLNQELAEKVKFYEQSCNNMPVIFYAKDLEGRFLGINKAFLELFKLTNEEVIGKTDHDLFPEKLADQFHENDKKIAATKKPEKSVEVAKDFAGVDHYYHSYKFPYFDEHQRVVAVGGVSVDVTDQIAAESKVKDSEMAILASSRFAAVGQMAAGVAHEINNPLAVILGSSETLQSKLKNGNLDPDFAINMIDKIDSSVNRISKIVKGLKSLSRDSKGDPKENIEISKVIDNTLGLCSERFKNSGIELSVSLPKEMLEVFCRPPQIEEILINLLNNSYYASERSEEKWVKIEGKVRGGKLEILISDSGSGVEPTEISKLFQHFYTTKPVGEGSGIGLSLSRSLAEENGGSLEYDSKQKHTSFKLTLPLVGSS